VYCYRFPSKEIFYELAQAEGLLTEEGQLITGGHGFAIDEIGVITQGGEWDQETGEVLVPPIVLDGHHCNFVGIAPESFDPYLVVVNHPVRVFAGGATQAPDTPVLEEIVAS
jgi:hypothetical protein